MNTSPSPELRGLSRGLHLLDSVTSRAVTAFLVMAVVIGFVVAIAVVGVNSNLQFAFTTGAAAITLVMVFVIQHTQGRQVLALQIKLDEILRAMPEADDRFVHVESGTDDELAELESRLVEHHASVREQDETD